MYLYTTHCPKCQILQKKLDGKKLNYEVVEDVEEIRKKGTSVPMLIIKNENDNTEKVLNYFDAVKYINTL